MIRLKYTSQNEYSKENLEIVVEAETATQAIKEFQKLLPDYAENMGWGVVEDSKAPETAKNSPSNVPAPAPTTQLEPVVTMFNPYNKIQIVLTCGKGHPLNNWRDLQALALRLQPAFHAEMKKLNPSPLETQEEASARVKRFADWVKTKSTSNPDPIRSNLGQVSPLLEGATLFKAGVAQFSVLVDEFLALEAQGGLE